MFHKGQHHQGERVVVEGDTDQAQNVWMVELVHAESLVQELGRGIAACVSRLCGDKSQRLVSTRVTFDN